MQEKWKRARPIKEFWDKHKDLAYHEAMQLLEMIDYRMQAYGDAYLYEETDGTLYEDYFSIGD